MTRNTSDYDGLVVPGGSVDDSNRLPEDSSSSCCRLAAPASDPTIRLLSETSVSFLITGLLVDRLARTIKRNLRVRFQEGNIWLVVTTRSVPIGVKNISDRIISSTSLLLLLNIIIIE